MRTVYIFLTYLTAIVLFGVLRLVLLFTYSIGAGVEVGFDSLLFKSLAIGLQFDTCVACYLLSLPLIGVLVGEIARIRHKLYYKIIHILTCTLFSFALLISSADIPYYHNFLSHLNATIFSYFSSFDFLFKMIVQEPTFLVYLFVFIGLLVGYIYLQTLYYRKTLLSSKPFLPLLKSIPLALVCIALCVIGLRGRLAQKSPIRIGTAYHCSDPFLNQLGLNASFNLLKSVEENSKTANRPLELIDSKEAEKVYREQMNRKRAEKRQITLPKGTNVVVVIMESMSADKVGALNPQSNLTPYLDKIISQGLSFENCYTAGVHTYNGVYSTIFGQPALFSRHSMKTTTIPQMSGLPNNFAQRGYQTLYFTTHDAQFDNISGFLFGNQIQRIISQADYPSSQVKSTLGVSDHVMFERAVEEFSQLDKTKPFFACMLTAADHKPYILPTDIPFKPKSQDIKQQITEYADWALGHFISLAQKTDWFSNTLFVFIADHGYAKPNSKYEMPLSQHHTPFVLYCPAQIPPDKDSCLALQIDLAPTVLSMLFSDYQNHTLGVDLLTIEREFAYFSADNSLGVLDKEHFLIVNQDNYERLYCFADSIKTNRLEELSEKAARMKRYAYSMLQKSSDMLKDNATGSNQP